MLKRVGPMVVVGALLALPALACASLLSADAGSTAPPATQAPLEGGAAGGLPSGGCTGNLGKIVLSYDPEDIGSVHYGIYVMDADGGNRVRISGEEAIGDSEPAWSPDRCSIAFTAFTPEGDRDIYVMTADGGSIQQLTTDPARDMFPDWSPDGESISFVSYRDGFRNIWVMAADGADQRQLTKNEGEYSQWQQWSPNGDEIAFTWNSGGPEGTSIWTVKPDGSGLREVYPPAGHLGDMDPTWSPDGTKLYVISNRSTLTEIWELSADGSGVRQLTQFGGSPSPTHSPRVSPDGKQLAFYGTGEETTEYGSEIYVINVDGSGLKDISHAIGADEWLDW